MFLTTFILHVALVAIFFSYVLQRTCITLEFLTIMKNETERLKLRQKYRNEVNPVLAEKHTPKDTYTFTDEYVFWLEEQLVKNINVIPCCESDSEQLCDDWIHKERVKQNDDKYCPICGKKLQ